ncbi:MAG: hypothetical protein UZ17_ACD001000865 [Acidobacteria bacterium OLB17]|nr:MAG: hypothetical protein UZ17_ACD001000865 [Acidobacteria bacterium OLB17]MCZ2389987.1 hypothetical protein [Acidobacteriota bacterium]
MNLEKTKLNFLKGSPKLSRIAKSGVSLHCHTEYSKEMLGFVPHYAAKLPIINIFWQKEKEKYFAREGKYPNFETGYWSPPLSPQAVYDIEKQQIEDTGLNALVSLTDHDCIDGNFTIDEKDSAKTVPISLEWTVPFDIGYFHVGVHNLPRDRAAEISKELIDFSFTKELQTSERLNELFAMLEEIPEVLVILNHPLWDIEMVGKEAHEQLLKEFLRAYGRWIHALEVNGFRSWSENKAVIELAEAVGIPVATGGDRHGCQPNTVINLTNSTSFEEFVSELRVDRHAEIALMPAYEQPLQSRQLQSFSEILSHYPAFRVGRQHWFDRVFFDIDNGKGLISLSSHGWQRGGPRWLRAAIWTLAVMGSPKARPLFRVLRKKADRVPSSLEKTVFQLPEDSGDLSQILTSDTA